jgi:hypothetical protein
MMGKFGSFFVFTKNPRLTINRPFAIVLADMNILNVAVACKKGKKSKKDAARYSG